MLSTAIHHDLSWHSPEALPAKADFISSVINTGIGIIADRQDRLFEAFEQGDSSTSKKYGGTGFWLTISNKLHGIMESRHQLDSTSCIGSTFLFCFQGVDHPVENCTVKNWESRAILISLSLSGIQVGLVE